jgi:hypothetical protein
MVDLISKSKKRDSERFFKRRNTWLFSDSSLIFDNSTMSLKKGDPFYFYNDCGVPMVGKILAFSTDNTKVYIDWDCFWLPVDIEKKIYRKKIEIKITPKIEALNEKANKIGNFENIILDNIQKLNIGKEVNIGYRQSCGRAKEPSSMIYDIWMKVIEELKKQKIYLITRDVKQKNSWATLSGGFWIEENYRLQKK